MRPRFSSAVQNYPHAQRRAKSLDALGGGVWLRVRCHDTPTGNAKDELHRASLIWMFCDARRNSWRSFLPPQGGGVLRFVNKHP